APGGGGAPPGRVVWAPVGARPAGWGAYPRPAAGVAGPGAPAGVTSAGPTLFAAVARLTAEPGPAPLADLVTVRPSGDGQVDVRFCGGRGVRVRPAGECPVTDLGG
ncbi:hypothetical protein ACFXDP_18435, partial [Streptomyces sp. NPDC059374]